MDIILQPKKNIVLDATLLSTLMSCPRLLDLRFNHRFNSIKGKSNSLEVGLIVHKVLEVFYWHIIHGFKRETALAAGFAAGELFVKGCPGCADVVQYPDESKKLPCGHQLDEFPGLKNTPAESDGQKYIGWKWALETCQQYFDHYKSDFWIPLEVEVVKAEVIYEDDEIRVLWKSKFDWIVDTLQNILPVDHKTSKQRRDTLSLNNQFMGQCTIMKTRNMVINKIGFQTSLKPEEKFTRVMMPYTADRLLEWQGEIVPHYAYQLLGFTEAGYWPPNFTHCETKYGNCIFAEDICSSNPAMREEAIQAHFYVGPEWNPENVED